MSNGPPSEQPAKPKTIGNLNGPWAIGLKFLLVIFPIAIGSNVAWVTWASQEIILSKDFRARGDRWTTAEAEKQTRSIMEELHRQVEQVRKDNLAMHEVMMQETRAALANLSRDNREAIDKINREGTIRGQPVYAAIPDLQTRLVASEKDRVSMGVKLENIQLMLSEIRAAQIRTEDDLIRRLKGGAGQ